MLFIIQKSAEWLGVEGAKKTSELALNFHLFKFYGIIFLVRVSCSQDFGQTEAG